MTYDVQAATELRQTVDELNVLIKDLRDRAEAAQDATEALVEAKTTGLEKAIQELRAKQDTLERKLKAPVLTETEAGGRTAKAVETRQAFLAWLKSPEAWAALPPEKRALVADATTSKILIPAELEEELVKALPAKTVIRGLVGSRPIGSDKLHRRSLTGVSVAWGKLELGVPLQESTPTVGEEFLYVRNLAGCCWIGVDLLEDTDIDLPAEIQEAFVNAIAPKEDEGFIKGDYAGGREPEGVLTRRGNQPNQIPTVIVKTASIVDFEDMLRLAYAVPDAHRVNGAYLTHPSTELALMLIKDAGGRYIWQPSIQAGTPNRVWNYPIYTSQFMPIITADAPAGTPYVVFGDWRAGYTIRDRRGITVQRLTELRATSGLVGFLVTKRVLGGVIRPEAFAILVEKA